MGKGKTNIKRKLTRTNHTNRNSIRKTKSRSSRAKPSRHRTRQAHGKVHEHPTKLGISKIEQHTKKQLIVAAVSVGLVILLSLLLFYQGDFVGKAITIGDLTTQCNDGMICFSYENQIFDNATLVEQDYFAVDIIANVTGNVSGAVFNVTYDPEFLTLESVEDSEGNWNTTYNSSDGGWVFFLGMASASSIEINDFLLVATINFSVNSTAFGTNYLEFVQAEVWNESGDNLIDDISFIATIDSVSENITLSLTSLSDEDLVVGDIINESINITYNGVEYLVFNITEIDTNATNSSIDNVSESTTDQYGWETSELTSDDVGYHTINVTVYENVTGGLSDSFEFTINVTEEEATSNVTITLEPIEDFTILNGSYLEIEFVASYNGNDTELTLDVDEINYTGVTTIENITVIMTYDSGNDVFNYTLLSSDPINESNEGNHTWQLTAYDLDGVNDSTTFTMTVDIDADSDGVGYLEDCNDTDSTVSENATYYQDSDGDEVGGTTEVELCAISAPTNYSDVDTDCDDTNATIWEEMDVYLDADEDGDYSDSATSFCTDGSTVDTSYDYDTSVGDDCDDDDATITADSEECTSAVSTETICDDGLDDDSDSLTDCEDDDCDGVEGDASDSSLLCEYATEATCDDEFDNDGDGDIDEDDSDCIIEDEINIEVSSDSDGTGLSAFTADESNTIEITVTPGEDTGDLDEHLLIVQVSNSDGNVETLVSQSMDALVEGDSETLSFTYTPGDDTYSVEVFVWSNWLDLSGEILMNSAEEEY